MRILKYIFLLILLFSIAVAVFVATQKGDFEVTQIRLINTPRNIVFNFVNDYRNWPSWASFDAEMKPEFPAFTSGKGGSFSWEGSENDGDVKTISVKENDSIVQQMNWNGLPANMYWTFKDSAGKTKVTLKVKGKIGFMPKIYAAMKGGANRIMEGIFEKSLVTLDKTLDREINTYNIKVDGIAEKTANYYLKQTITSTIDNMPRNMRIMQSKLMHFFTKNNIPTAGKPFVLYDYYDKSKNLTKFSVCVPIRDEIYTAPESDVTFGKFETFHAVKTTLTGDYSHLREAWDKTRAYIEANHLTKTDGNSLEWYKVGKEDGKGPSKWVTEIYIPIKDAAVAPAPPAAATVTAPTPAAPKPETPKTEEEISIP
ncbi:MAG: transcriptional regulator [Flavobacterium sp.]|nr:MAG: transcriptional regulator [Flavobacterium sp.]